MEFQTPYNRFSHDFEPVKPDDEEDLVDRSGYRTTEQQVNELMRAGQRLADFRKHAEFMDLDSIPDDYEGDPTRSPDFDLVDVKPLYEAVKRQGEIERDKIREKQEKDQAEQRRAKIEEAKAILAEANTTAESTTKIESKTIKKE